MSAINFNTTSSIDLTTGPQTYTPDVFIRELRNKASFPSQVIVTGDLDLRGLRDLPLLPQGLTVAGILYLSSWDFERALIQGIMLPSNVTVDGIVRLGRSSNVKILPQKLTVTKNLYIMEMGVTSLPEELHVEGDMYLIGETELISLSKRLKVGCDLILDRCAMLRSLSEELNVGSLTIDHCPLISSLQEIKILTIKNSLKLKGLGLESLPNDLNLDDLGISNCTRFRAMPDRITIRNNLTLENLPMTSLPDGLNVGWYLTIWGLDLRSLPQRLKVGGTLDICGCPVTSLPQDLIVGHNIDLTRCTHLTSLPNWITTLGDISWGGERKSRKIYLERTGLSETILNRLRETPAPGIQFFISHAASVPAQTFSNLDEALTFWREKAEDDSLNIPSITIEREMDRNDVVEFLRRLTETAEYKNLQTRPMLAKRVIDAFAWMGKEFAAFDMIHESLTSCDDRIMSGLEEIELMKLLHQIENTSHSEDELRKLGKSFLLLAMVNEKAKAHQNTLSWVDEIEVRLAFQIGLAEQLNLPVKTRNMIFRLCAQISDEQICQIGDTILKECTDEKLNIFLETWGPWIKYQKKNCPVPVYEDLPTATLASDSNKICPITQDIPEKPVLYGKTVYDYDALVTYYRTDGKNPLDRSSIDLKQLRRVI